MINSGSVVGTIEQKAAVSGEMAGMVPIAGTVSIGGMSGSKNAVLYVEQDLTDEQIMQARENIRVIGKATTGITFTPYVVDEDNDYAYIYDAPVEAADGAEIFNDYENNIASGLWSTAMGCKTQCTGNYSFANGWWTRADGQCAVASGLLSRASGHFSHAEGTRTIASINNAHAEGDMTKASGRQSHAEGQKTVSSGFCSHAEGSGTVSSGFYSHSEGLGTIAKGKNQTAMGKYNIADTTNLLIVGRGSSDTARKNAHTVDSSGNGWFAGDVYIKSTGGLNKDAGSKKLATEEYVNSKTNMDHVLIKTEQSLTDEEVEQVRVNLQNAGKHVAGHTMIPYELSEDENYNIVKVLLDPVVAADGAEIHNDYTNNIATGLYSKASGFMTQATGDYSSAEGLYCVASNICAIATGRNTTASGPFAHAEGTRTVASSNDAHAEGDMTQATAARSHTEGYATKATEKQAHAEGMNTTASGLNSHAEGEYTEAKGRASWAGGAHSLASGTRSFANGSYTIAAGTAQTALGKYNVSDTTSLLIVGNGTSDTARSNAFTIDTAGNGWFAGNVIANGVPTEDNHVITKKYLEDNIAQLILTNLPVYEGEVETV